ncbi:MAG TPA: hypothetical protein VJH03_11665 [Blastocatellia bacterium]|nr:hypothetical protein [Blastocatellia bacterium]
MGSLLYPLREKWVTDASAYKQEHSVALGRLQPQEPLASDEVGYDRSARVVDYSIKDPPLTHVVQIAVLAERENLMRTHPPAR